MTPSRRQALAGISGVVASMLGGCQTLPPAAAPKYRWGQVVQFHGIRFEFFSVRFDATFVNWVNQRTVAADTFLILDMFLTNQTGAPLPFHFQPIYRLIDDGGSIYEPHLQHSMAINMGRGGRVPYGQSMNPNVRLNQELVFEVPRRSYRLQVIAPNRASVGFAGGLNSSGPFFYYELPGG